MSTLYLDKLLDPDSLVVVGASARENSPGLQLTRNLFNGGYKGTLYLVNPRYQSILETTCYKTIHSLPAVPDLAILLTPAFLLKYTLAQCARKGIRVVMVMSGSDKSQSLHRYAQSLGIRLVGPYCAGLIRPHIGLNASYSENVITKGSLALLSQSASLASAMLDWAQTSNVGFSALLSTGEDGDISLSDLLDLLAEDWQTRAVIVYIERVSNSRSFLSALSAISRLKPVVLMHSANEGASYCDALTRSGEAFSSDAVFQAAQNRAGVVRIRTFQNLFAAAKILSTSVRVKGNRLGIISNGSAPAMMAMERMHIKFFQVPALNADSRKELGKELKGNFTGDNPIVLRSPTKLIDDYTTAIRYLEKLKQFDAILVIFVPDSRNDPTLIAQSITQCLPMTTPLLACWMGDASVLDARNTLSQIGIPSFRTPEGAIDGFDFLHRYFVSQQQLLQLPNPASRTTRADTNSARYLVRATLRDNQRVLDQGTTHALLKLIDIPTLPARHAHTLEEAITLVEEIGFPIAMKLLSHNISYRSSVISTQLNIESVEAMTSAWHDIVQRLDTQRPDAEFQGVLLESMHTPDNSRHLALSISRDTTFGPVISIGVGGELKALAGQHSVQLPPLNRFLIDEMLNTRDIKTYMGAYRNKKSVCTAPVSLVLRRLSELACEVPEIFSLDIDPLVVSEQGSVAMNVHITLETPTVSKRYAHLAIHPYPWQWMRKITLKNGSSIQLRPIRPDDAESIISLVRNMTPESRYFRFMHALNELSPQMVVQFTKLDYDRQMAFIAMDEHQEIAGASRYIISNDRLSGEFAISLSEKLKGQGLASALMRLLMEHASEQKLQTLYGDVLRSNKPMQAMMQSLGFIGKHNADDPDVIRYIYTLNADQ